MATKNFILIASKDKLELIEDSSVDNIKLGKGGNGSVFKVKIEYKESLNIKYKYNGFILDPKEDEFVALKIFHYYNFSDTDFNKYKENIDYINEHKICKKYFVPTMTYESKLGKFLIMKLCKKIDLLTDTDIKLNKIIQMNLCLHKNYIASNKNYSDFKLPNLAEYQNEIVFLDTEDFNNIDNQTLGAVHGVDAIIESDNINLQTLGAVHGVDTIIESDNIIIQQQSLEKKIIILILFMYIIYKAKIIFDFTPGKNKDRRTRKFNHILGITPDIKERLKKIKISNFKIKKINTKDIEEDDLHSDK